MKKNNKNFNKAILLTTSAILITSIVGDLTIKGSQDVEAESIVKLSEKKQGDIITIGGKDFYVISHGEEGTKIMSVESIYQVFDPDNINTYDPNDSNNIGYYLNNTYYNDLPSELKSVISSSVWNIGNELDESAQTVEAKVGILTRSEFLKVLVAHGGNIPNLTEEKEWTITPVYGTFHTVFNVFNDHGDVYRDYLVNHEWLVRPALVIPSNLSVSTEGKVEIFVDSSNNEAIPLSKGNNNPLKIELYTLLTDIDTQNPEYKVKVLNNENVNARIVNDDLVIDNTDFIGLLEVEVSANQLNGGRVSKTIALNIQEASGNEIKANLELLKGEFTLQTSPTTSFGTVKLTAEKQVVSTNFEDIFKVIDARGTQEGWKVTVTATPFKEETFEGFVGTPTQLPLGSLSLDGLASVSQVGKVHNSQLPTITDTSQIIDSGAVNLINANEGEGMGEFNLIFGEGALHLVVDSTTAKIDKVNYPEQNTPYVSTLTWDLVTGP